MVTVYVSPQAGKVRASVVLAYKVTEVTSDSWPDKEATMGTERVENSS